MSSSYGRRHPLHDCILAFASCWRVDDSNRELMRWISQSGVPKRFVLTGERRDVDRCLVAIDVFCPTSTFEAFPNVVAEAMAMGVPLTRNQWSIQALPIAICCIDLQRVTNANSVTTAGTL